MKKLLKLIIIATALTLPTIGVISAKTDDLGLSNLTDEELAQIESLMDLEKKLEQTGVLDVASNILDGNLLKSLEQDSESLALDDKDGVTICIGTCTITINNPEPTPPEDPL